MGEMWSQLKVTALCPHPGKKSLCNLDRGVNAQELVLEQVPKGESVRSVLRRTCAMNRRSRGSTSPSDPQEPGSSSAY